MKPLRKTFSFVLYVFFLVVFLIKANAQLQPPAIRVAPGNESVTITWDPVPGATGYNLYWGPSPKINTFNWFNMKVPLVTSPFVQTQLGNGIRYYFIVQSISNKGSSYGSYVASTIPSTNPSAVPKEIKIRPFGDSITYGVGFADNTFCPTYHPSQKACPYPPVTWGGGYRGWMTLISVNDQNIVFETDGDQNGGSNLLQMLTSTRSHDGYPGIWTIGMIGKSKEPSDADVTLVHLGTNDMFWGPYFNHDENKAADSLFTVVNNLLTTNPDTEIHLAKIIKVFPHGHINQVIADTLNNKIDRYNNLIQEKWNILPSQNKSRVKLVDMNSVLTSASEYADGVHPNKDGYLKMACTWIRSINGMAANSSDPCSGVTTEAVTSLMPDQPAN